MYTSCVLANRSGVLKLRRCKKLSSQFLKKAMDTKGTTTDVEMLDEYDFSDGVRGKYAERYATGTNIVMLAPDVAEVFSDSESVNEALRALIRIARETLPEKEAA